MNQKNEFEIQSAFLSDRSFVDINNARERQNNSEEKKKKVRRVKLIYNGRKYILKEKNKDGTFRYKCSNLKCKGKVTIKLSESLNSKTNIEIKKNSIIEHNESVCYSDPALENKTKLETEFLTTLATKISTDSSQKIFSKLAENYRTEEISGMAYHNVKRKGQRIKSVRHPPPVSNLKQFGEYLSNEYQEMLKFDSGDENESSMTAVVLNVLEKEWPNEKKTKKQKKNKKKNYQAIPPKKLGTPSSTIVVLGDPELAEKIVKKKEKTIDLYVDGTFSISPAGLDVCQTYVIQAASHNQAFPIAIALMERKTTNSYEKLFSHIFNELLPDLKNLSIKVHMDFEKAAHNALRTIVPGVNIVGCTFHAMQAQNKQAKKKGALKEFKKNIKITKDIKKKRKEMKKTLRLIQLIPYLPVDLIDENLVDFLVSRCDPINAQYLTKYVKYFKKNWINNKTWPPIVWSIYNEPNATNNFSESRNKDMAVHFGRHSNPWNFIDKLIIYHGQIYRKFHSDLKSRGSDTYDKKKIEYIKNCEFKLMHNKYERVEFLEEIAAYWEDELEQEQALIDLMNDETIQTDDEFSDDTDNNDSSDEESDEEFKMGVIGENSEQGLFVLRDYYADFVPVVTEIFSEKFE